MLEKLRPEEAATVLHQLLDKHSELRQAAEELAANCVSSSSIEDVSQTVYCEITSIGLDTLNERAGAHSWGYVEPSEAATELLSEALEEYVEDMKRRAELGLVSTAGRICVGIVDGLYRARNANSDGALGWAVDFPIEEAGFVVEEFLAACPPSAQTTAHATLMPLLAERAPEWAEALARQH